MSSMQGSLEESDRKMMVDGVLWRDLWGGWQGDGGRCPVERPAGGEGFPRSGLQMGSHVEACGRGSEGSVCGGGPMQRPLERGVVTRKSLQTGLWRGL